MNKLKEYNKEYYNKNKDKLKEYNKEYYHKNKDKIKLKNKEYQKEHYKNNKNKLKDNEIKLLIDVIPEFIKNKYIKERLKLINSKISK